MPAPAPPPSSPSTLPDRITLAAHHRVLPRGPDARQVGLDPVRGRVVEDLCPATAAMLDELGPAPVGSAELVRRAVELGAERDAAIGLLHGLLTAGLVVDARLATRAAHRRADSQVAVRGDGPLAAGLAAALVRAGVGGVHVRTSGRVGPGDLAVGVPVADLGRERARAVADLLAGLSAGAPSPAPGRTPPDLVVLTDAQSRPPGETDALTARATEHLVVRVRDGRGVVGPLVLPGRSACLRCLDLYRTGRDPGWPGLAAATTGHVGTAEPPVLAATAALGAAQALLALDGPATGAAAPPTLGATLEIDLEAGAVVARRWSAHPGCPCGAAGPDRVPPAGAPCGAARPRETIGG